MAKVRPLFPRVPRVVLTLSITQTGYGWAALAFYEDQELIVQGPQSFDTCLAEVARRLKEP